MEANRPWETNPLELIHDNAPGDWRHYSESFRATWRRARAARTGFINLESDIVPRETSFRDLLACPEPLCMVPYPIYHYHTSALLGYSATVELRVPGGWDAHLAREGDEWAEYGDLGLVKFGPSICQLPIEEVPPLQFDNGLLNEAVYSWLRARHRRFHLLHLHWPAAGNNHLKWDRGDSAHHPGGHPNDRLLDAR